MSTNIGEATTLEIVSTLNAEPGARRALRKAALWFSAAAGMLFLVVAYGAWVLWGANGSGGGLELHIRFLIQAFYLVCLPTCMYFVRREYRNVKASPR